MRVVWPLQKNANIQFARLNLGRQQIVYASLRKKLHFKIFESVSMGLRLDLKLPNQSAYNIPELYYFG